MLGCAGQGECDRAVTLLEEEARRLRHGRLKLRLMPAALYAGLPAAHQLAALNPAPRGYRKAKPPACLPAWTHMSSSVACSSACHSILLVM